MRKIRVQEFDEMFLNDFRYRIDPQKFVDSGFTQSWLVYGVFYFEQFVISV